MTLTWRARVPTVQLSTAEGSVSGAIFTENMKLRVKSHQMGSASLPVAPLIDLSEAIA
jgi:hypothetical protein